MQFILKKPHYRLILATALAMLSGWIISATYLYIASDSIAKSEAQITARHTARQAAITIQPYILAEDIISLNFFLNSLIEARQVNGVAVYNKQSSLIARAGETSGTEHQVILGNQQTPTGVLKLYTSHEPEQKLLMELLWQVAILSFIILLATLVTLWLSLKQLTIQTPEQHESDEVLPQVDAEEKASPSAAFAQTLEETINSGSLPQEQQSLERQPLETDETANNTTHHQSTVTDDEIFITENSVDLASGLPDEPPSTEGTLNNDELVDLLRPDSTQRMPHFVPAPMQPDEDQAKPQRREATYEFEEYQQEPEQPPSALKTNPLRAHERTEEQMDLYSFEHQLELSLQAGEAAYLFYIDATTGHADYVEPEEHNYLLQTYEKLIKKVSAIYGGVVSIDASGDMQLFFDDQDKEDGHGVHALCAAKLFTLLYKAFNQARIKSFKPVLNLHMAIVRGNREKFNLIKEEALFLTRTTQSNELISHTALTEARQLKTTLLSSADVRREDEDKVLILSLTASYQALLNKQATHLLSKPVKETENAAEKTADH